MKKLVALLAATLSGALTLTAATPVAVWDGDFTATQTGYTLNRSGNAISQDNSTITIDQNVGVKVDFTTGFSSAMTVMFKYSNLSFNAQKTIATSFCSGGDENRTGVYLASGGTANGIWNTGDWAHPASTAFSASSGVLAFSYHKSNGTGLYYIDSAGVRTEVFFNSDLKASGDAAINGCTIGGERAKTGATLLSAATGMKITAIAIFNGGLTEAEMTDYEWPSDGAIIIKSDTTVSAINSQVGGEAEIKLLLSPGVTITMDESFTATTVKLVSFGNVTLAADSQPSAEELAKLNLSGVAGAVKRSWLEPDVIGLNFSADGYNYSYYYNGAKDTSSALAAGSWYHNGQEKSSNMSVYADSLTVVEWSSRAVWSETSGIYNGTFIQGYLEPWSDASVSIKASAIPFEKYDVIIYCSAGDSNAVFTAKQVNGKYYKWDATTQATVEASGFNDTWGAARVSKTAVYGTNAIRVDNLSGPLSILGGFGANMRGSISAIQIIPADVEIDATNGYVPDATRLENIRKDYREVTIKGDGDNGATLNYGSTTDTFTSHIVFDGGVHSVTYNNSGTASIAFAQNASSPVFETTNGASLNLYSIDLSGWQGNAQNKVPYSNMLVGEGTTLNLTPSEGSESRTFYYQGRFTIEPGATLKTSYTHQNSVFRLNGGAYEGYEQIYVPASELGSSHAVITGVDGNTGLRLHSDATVGVGIFVGENSALDFDIAITSSGSAPIGKWGDGVVNFNGDLSGYQGTLTVHEGTVNVGSATTLANVVNDGTLTFAYGVTISGYSGLGNVVVDISPIVNDGVIASGSYTLLPGAAVDPGHVEVTGLPEASGFSVQITSEGIVLTDEDVFSPVWTGGSGNWTDEQFDGRSGSTEDLPVVFANSADSDVAVLVSGDKSVTVIGFEADDTTYTLKPSDAQNAAKITSTGSLTVSGHAPVRIETPLEVAGISLAEGTEFTYANTALTIPAGALTGSGKFILDPGSGNTYTMSTAIAGFTGALTINSGTVKMGNKLCLGAGDRAAPITVKGGAILDLNGTTHGGDSGNVYNIVLEEGATYANSVTISDTKMFDVSGLTLQGNATVDASRANIGVTRHYHNPTTIALGEYTLTKIGDNDMYLSQPTISGAGTFRVSAGTVHITRYYYGGADAQPSVEGTLEVDKGATVQLDTNYKSGVTNSVNNLVANGEVKLASTGEGAFLVTGSLSGTGTVSTPIVFAPSAVFKPTGTGYLTITESLSLPTSTVGEEDVPYMVIDLTDALASGTTAIPLFKVGSAENLPDAENIGFVYPGQEVPSQTLPKGWTLSKTSGGRGYKLSKGNFSIRLR